MKNKQNLISNKSINKLHNISLKQVLTLSDQSKKISNDQELIQSDPTSCPQNQKRNN